MKRIGTLRTCSWKRVSGSKKNPMVFEIDCGHGSGVDYRLYKTRKLWELYWVYNKKKNMEFVRYFTNLNKAKTYMERG